jgi:adhesin HecA-like repeat protein
MRNRRSLARRILTVAAIAAGSGMTASSAQEIDQASGLIVAAGWQQVQATCTECHSTQLIIQNAGSKAVWRSRLLWMQNTQGLHQLEPALEESILSYLATNYGPKQSGRRPPLPAHLMPDNPYPSSE